MMDDDVMGMWERWGKGTAHAQNAVLGGTKQVIVQNSQPDGFVVCVFFFFLSFLIYIFWGREATRVKGRYKGLQNMWDWGTWCELPKDSIKEVMENSCHSMFEKAHSAEKPQNPQCVA